MWPSQPDILGLLDSGGSLPRGHAPVCKHVSAPVGVPLYDAPLVKANPMAKSSISEGKDRPEHGYRERGFIGGMRRNSLPQDAGKQVFIVILTL